MFIEPVMIEHVIHVSDKEKQEMLKNHFNEFFHIYCDSKFEPIASSEIVDGLHRHVSGISSPFLNAILGTAEGDAIKRQLAYFNEINIPFIWYVDEYETEFKTKLIEHGFQDIGTFQGMIGCLDKAVPDPELTDDCVIERVQSEAAMDEFIELICETFEIHGENKNLYKKGLWQLANTESPILFHWLVRKEGEVVSALSTFIEGAIVSFWNGASLPSMRRQGLNTAVARVALKHAISKGCRFGTSYLMAEGLALGICTRLGGEPKWPFSAFLSPQKGD